MFLLGLKISVQYFLYTESLEKLLKLDNFFLISDFFLSLLLID